MNIGVIRLAIEEASKSTHKHRVAAVVFKGNRIISSGHNAVRANKINPKYKVYNEALHAEQAALLNLDWSKLRGYSILVVRVNGSGKLIMSKPCSVCEKLLRHIGIKNVYYSNENGEIILEKF